jgi:hypothetical protein
VLKKAGIVVATAAAGLLAVSPLAFAGDDDDHDGHKKVKKVEVEDVNKAEESSSGLINISDNNLATNVCANELVTVVEDVLGAVALFGAAEADQSDRNLCAQEAEAGDEIEQEND